MAQKLAELDRKLASLETLEMEVAAIKNEEAAKMAAIEAKVTADEKGRKNLINQSLPWISEYVMKALSKNRIFYFLVACNATL